MKTKKKYYTIKSCLECGKQFESLISRNQKCCSSKCSAKYTGKSKSRIEKIKKTKLEKYGNENYVNVNKAKETSLKRYGVDNPSKTQAVKEKIKETTWEKFGVDYYFQSDQIKEDIRKKFGVENVSQLDEVKEKKRNTFIKKYGVKNPFQSEEIKSQIKSTIQSKYNVDYPSQSPDIRKKMDTKFRKSFYQKLNTTHKLLSKVEPLFSEEEYVNTNRNNLYKFKCLKCDSEFEDHIDGGHLPRCQSCYPLNKGSICEQEIYDFICELVGKSKVHQNRRDLVGLELDIFIEDLNIAIEYDSFYYHSSKVVSSDYHLKKTKTCEDKGIRLIHIFEDEWVNKQTIVKEKLESILGISQPSLYARNCDIEEIDTESKRAFLERNHIQGSDKSNIKLGAFYNGDLVAVMTFSKYRKALGRDSEGGCYELSRFATNQKVIGIGSKLLSYFIRQYSPKTIISYADRRFSTKNSIYEKVGFELKHETPPNYWYFKNGYSKRHHRFSFRKNVLKDKLKIFDESLTEWENMQLNGYDRIFDCGSLLYEMNLT